MMLFHKDRELYYQRYLSEVKQPREPQTAPMSVGSAFDAYVKSYLYRKLVGKGDAKHEFEYMFESQVEPHNRDQALKDGLEVFNLYRDSGALADLILDMEGCIGEPKFETTVTGVIKISGDESGVVILGKPDLRFISNRGARVILDWKVNGFYSNTPPSPKTGYHKLFPGLSMHKDCMPTNHNGFTINAFKPINKVDSDWASQCTTYAWLLGEEVGSDFIVVIDQIVCNKHSRNHRIARHKGLVQEEFQFNLYNKYKKAWDAINTGHIFYELSKDESDAKIATLERLVNSNQPTDETFDMLNGKRWR